MASRTRPKLAAIVRVNDFSHWLAETVQEKVAKENAGFVQIERANDDVVTVTNHGARFVIRLQSAGPDGDQ